MKEFGWVVLISVFLILSGGVLFYLSIFYSGFSFNRAELIIDENFIQEKLYYSPNKDYHTLYRNFNSKLINPDEDYDGKNFIKMTDVMCQKGTPYSQSSKCYFYEDQTSGDCLTYTEPNEYGCGFGNSLGFSSEEDYWILGEYSLNAENLFFIDGEHYIKFIAYSKGDHKYLNEDNFIITGDAVKKKRYFPNEDVIIYLPYDEIENEYTIFLRNEFEYDEVNFFIPGVFFLIPGFFIFFIWLIFGKEKIDAEIHEQVSFYPNERRPWKIAAYFNPPFLSIDRNFFSSVLMDFYHRKIIDLKTKKKGFGNKVYIKLNKGKKLDNLEKMFYNVLKNVESKADKKYFEEDYFCMNDALKQWGVQRQYRKDFKEILKEVKKEGKSYINCVGSKILIAFSFIYVFLGFMIFATSSFIGFFIPLGIAVLIISILSTVGSALFISFREENYKEYLHWQAYKNYLSKSFSITKRDHKAVKMWDHILVYATALGVSKKVIDGLKSAHIINEKQAGLYQGVYVSSFGFSASSGAGGASGAGGGVGGGGGGGR